MITPLPPFRNLVGILAIILLNVAAMRTDAAEADAATASASKTVTITNGSAGPVTLAEDSAMLAALKALEGNSVASVISSNAEVQARVLEESLEKLRLELGRRVSQNSEAITSSVTLIETTLAQLHARQMEAVENSNRTILIIGGIVAVVGLIGLIIISLILVRAITRFSELAVAAAPRGLLGHGQTSGMLGSGEPGASRPGAAEEAAGRFQGAIDQLQRRIMELEHSAQSGAGGRHPSVQPGVVRPDVDGVGSALNIKPLVHDAADRSPITSTENSTGHSRTTVLLGKGQALLNLDAAEPALQCFEEALTLEPNNADALVKKGMAFEKLQDWERALESYNLAIAVDSTMTVAYLYRGGVCNRLQRYREALDSYEQALHTEKSSRAS